VGESQLQLHYAIVKIQRQPYMYKAYKTYSLRVGISKAEPYGGNEKFRKHTKTPHTGIVI